MKISELLQEQKVIQFAPYKKMQNDVRFRRDREQEIAAAYQNLKQEDANETQTVHELAEFEQWMHVAKQKARVPGFANIDEVTQFLTIDTEIPNKISKQSAVKWFADMDEFDRDKVKMISHHVDRLVQVYELLRNKLQGLQNIWHNRFNGAPPKDWDAMVGADWLLSEFKDDIKILTNCKKLVELLGQ